MTTAAHFDAIDSVLDLIGAASDRTRDVARQLADEGAGQGFVEALEAADRELHATHLALFRTTAFGPQQRHASEQLRLAG